MGSLVRGPEALLAEPPSFQFEVPNVSAVPRNFQDARYGDSAERITWKEHTGSDPLADSEHSSRVGNLLRLEIIVQERKPCNLEKPCLPVIE
jgi:hypothetical protein